MARQTTSPLRVGQALVNLVDNALTHGNGTVELAAEERNGFVELHVRDGGSGFPDDFRARAFDRFYRSAAARSMPGAGLGLAIVREVAEAHGGTVEADNAQDGGAVVRLSLNGAARSSKTGS